MHLAIWSPEFVVWQSLYGRITVVGDTSFSLEQLLLYTAGLLVQLPKQLYISLLWVVYVELIPTSSVVFAYDFLPESVQIRQCRLEL